MSNLPLNTQFTIISLLLLINTARVHARQCIQVSGRTVCRGLSTGARVGIGIGVIVLAMILLGLLCCCRRRRLHRRNLGYLSEPNNGQPQVSQNQSTLPAYPPQAYGQKNLNNPQYAPPPGQPPV
ncbi:hypothetical protein Clacol_003224 [Clathrus columnatus]|uniref:Uncharacterized protein n=1 Tax=Clathrus columnatus TaxID=1419009 RepID=A0AAV5A6A1_9AGAM|nr:hypothetical protein Clacol_003224 [Clathrus columnatus]